MSLAAGVRLGPYEIGGLIGAGGMGEVYQARDTRLDRAVAVKVLPSEFTLDDARRARFEREARAISALAHPHICTLHDVGEQDGQAYLVMEHLEGETLARRLLRGPLPLSQALELGAQMADALGAAHRQGIVHRDLKPGNVMLTGHGAKLLDFGLARPIGHSGTSAGESLTASPTDASPLTGPGAILGTAPYMAPEQLEGRPVDPRTDLWALGAVLYEMVSGRRAFEGSSAASLAAAILEREPEPLAALQPLTPPALERVVTRCLAKSPDARWESAHDVAGELRWIASPGSAAASAPFRRAAWRRRSLVLAGLGLVVASAGLGALVSRRLLLPATAPDVVRSRIGVEPAEELNGGGPFGRFLALPPGGSRTALAWTPDGRALVFAGRRAGAQQLYLRPLEADAASALDGTSGAQIPAVSQDGRWVAFYANRAIRRAALAGGPVSTLVDGLDIPSGLALGGEGEVYYDAPDRAIWSVSPERAPTRVTRRLESETSHGLPHALPGGQALLYTVRRRQWTWGDEEVVAHVLATGARRPILQDAADARYAAPGHLVFLRRGTLFAARFDPERLEVSGAPVPVLGAVAQALTSGQSRNVTGAGQFSVAPTGALAYLPGEIVPHLTQSLVTIDRAGSVRRLSTPTRSYVSALALSPDGRRLAFITTTLGEQPLWIHDLERGTLDKLSAGGETDFPRFTPDGRRVAFGKLDRSGRAVAWQHADRIDAAEVLVRGSAIQSSWSPDGRSLALVDADDIWIASIGTGGAVLSPLARTPDREGWPEISPDGRWLAYASNASGRFEVYVQPFPGPGARQQVSLEGGESPAWNPAGGELLFLSTADSDGRRRMWAVDVLTNPPLSIGSPRRLFEFLQTDLRLACQPVRCYAVAPDGRLFYGTQAVQPLPGSSPAATEIQLVLNWTQELRTRLGSDAP